MKTPAFRKPCLLHEGPAGRCETQLGSPNVVLTVPPHTFYLSDMLRELYILSPEDQLLSHRVTVTRFCDTLVLTALLSSPSATSSPFFILP
jgi:hypothetical protein